MAKKAERTGNTVFSRFLREAITQNSAIPSVVLTTEGGRGGGVDKFGSIQPKENGVFF